MPWNRLRWAWIANAGAKTNTHLAAFATGLTVITGQSFVAIGYAQSPDENASDNEGEYLPEGMGHFCARDALEAYSGQESNDGSLQFEFFVLPRDATL